MGFGTSFTKEIYLNRQLFDSKYEVKSKIKELEDNIAEYREEILMYAAATPKDIHTDQDQDILSSIKCRVKELFEFLEEDYRLLHNLYHFEEYLDENPNTNLDQYKDI